jgi:hypothetical protein
LKQYFNGKFEELFGHKSATLIGIQGWVKDLGQVTKENLSDKDLFVMPHFLFHDLKVKNSIVAAVL